MGDTITRDPSDIDLSAEIRRVWQLMSAKQPSAAILACQKLNAQYPHCADGWHAASHLALKLRNSAKALDYIEKAIALQPDKPVWQLQKILCLRELGNDSDACALAQGLAEVRMPAAHYYTTLGAILTHFQLYAQALRVYEKAANLEPGKGVHHFNKAAIQRFLGRIADAEHSCGRAIAQNPHDYEAYVMRSDLRQQTIENNHVSELQQLLSAGISDRAGRAKILFSLAKEYEDLGEYEKSFSSLRQGADLRRSHMRYKVETDIGVIDEIVKQFSAEHFSQQYTGCESNEPFFVIGLPRTGTTLVERIISSHSDVKSAGELNNFAQQLTLLIGKESAAGNLSRHDLVAASARINFADLGQAYLDSTRPLSGGTAHFIDKLPLNFLYAGLISRALPRAKIIHLTRHPLATCYAIYKRLFKNAYPYSYDLTEIGRYYIAYRRLMAHWNTVMPGKICTVQYENLISDTETEVQSLLQFLELPWQNNCLRFHENEVASTTASAVQVRQPIYQSSMRQWQNYRSQLQPLIEILEDAGVSTR